MYISELVDCCNLLEWVNAFSNKFAVFGSLYFANNNCTLWPWISPSLVSGPLLVSLRTNFGYKSHNYEPCKQLKKVRMLQKGGRGVSVQSPRTTYNEAAATRTSNGLAAGRIITEESLAGYVWWLLSLPEPLKHLQEKILQVLKRERVKMGKYKSIVKKSLEAWFEEGSP